MNKSKLKSQLERHEARKRKLYECTSGKLTIGVGRNIEDNGLRDSEIDLMLENDINEIYEELFSKWPQIKSLDDVRQNVLVNMAFNMGVPRLMGFNKMFNALALRDYSLAAKEMLDSRWAVQVGYRAMELSVQMRTGEY